MLKTVYYEITTACPLSCPHCHVSPVLKHDAPVTRSFTDYAVDLMILKKLGFNAVVLSGGEPTLHPHFNDIIQYSNRLGFKTRVITNGLNIAKLEKLNGEAEVWFSLDYYGEKQDEYRGYKGLWSNYTKLQKTVSIRSTLMKNNLKHVQKLIEKAVENNRNITVVPYKGDNHYTPTPTQLASTLNFIFQNHYEKHAVIDEPCISAFLTLKANLPKKQSLCPAADTIIKVTADGKATPCPFLNNPITTTTDPQLPQKINQTRQKIINTYNGKCETCPYKKWCGGCKAHKNTYCITQIL